MKSLKPIIKLCIGCNQVYWYALEGYEKPKDWSDSSWSFQKRSFSKSLAYCKTCHEVIQKEKGYLNYVKRFGNTPKQQRENFRKLSKRDKVRIAMTCWVPSNKCINCGVIVDFSERLQFSVGRYGRTIFACSEECWDEYQYLWWKADLRS